MSGKSADGELSKVSPTPTTIGNGNEVIYVDFEDGDRRNPQNYPLLKKWAITLTTCTFTAITAAASSSFSISGPSLMQDLNCTEFQVALGLGIYAIGFGVIPLVSSSFSEEVGRRPLYIFSSVMFTLTQIMVAMAPNIQAVLAGRALAGIFGSTGATLVGGTVADIWKPHDRGLPMAIFAFTSLFAMGLGAVIGGVIQSNLGWRWVQWIQVVFCGFLILLVLLVLSETRSSIILMKMARSQRKITGNGAYKAKSEINKPSLWGLIKTSCTRPLYFLLTEPIVQCISLWSGFVWGVVYCLVEAITPMFESIYGFNVVQTGYTYITMSIGAIIGCLASMYQDKLYRKYFSQKQQEARLHVVCAGALCLPVGMFIFAWTASPKIHWVVPLIGLTLFASGVMIIFQVAFLYTADCYNTYASSAIAGQTLFRNSMAMIFPLFTQKLFDTLTYKWGLTLFACLALLMAPTPFVLYFYGSKIRARSIASRKILAATDGATPQSCCGPSSSSPSSTPGSDKV